MNLKRILLCSGFILCYSLFFSAATFAQKNNSSALNPKKGVGLSVNSDSGACLWLNKILKLNISWYYRWGYKYPPGLPDSIDWPPMIYSFHGDTVELKSQIAYVDSLRDQGKVHHLLGFNEPDNSTQANMTVNEAIEAWPYLMRVNVPLGSPGCVDDEGGWMKSFMAEINVYHYRVDFVCIHWYRGPDVKAFFSYLNDVYNLYHKPLWITEFAVADNSATTVENNRYSPEKVLAFMRAVLPVLDTLSYVERYAWHGPPGYTPKHWSSLVWDSTCALTRLGKYYANYQYGILAPQPDSPGVSIYSGIPPENGLSLKPVFKWNSSPNAVGYQLQVSTENEVNDDGSFKPQNLVVDTTLADTSIKETLELSASTVYYWHVSAFNNLDTSAYSNLYFFKTRTVASINNNNVKMPLKFSLRQNYPNPFNPATEIRYSIPHSDYICLKVYNVLGRKIATLFKGFRKAGIYKINFDASKLPSGVYLYELQSAGRSIAKKMILLK